MTDIDMERLEYFRDRYHALVVIDYKVADDNHTGSLLSLDDVIKRLNKVTVENEQLKKELFESEKDYLIETYSDNPVRRDDKIQSLKEEFKARFGDVE